MSSSPLPAAVPGCEPYRPVHHVRLVTAASLFDGHDAAINIMRRLLQATGAEVIHLGHNRSVREIVDCAIQEDAQGIALTSYQGGHLEFLQYMHDLVAASGRRILIFAGGGGTILPAEIAQLHAYGIARVFSPDDGRAMGLQGMINEVMRQCDFPVGSAPAPVKAASLGRASREGSVGGGITASGMLPGGGPSAWRAEGSSLVVGVSDRRGIVGSL